MDLSGLIAGSASGAHGGPLGNSERLVDTFAWTAIGVLLGSCVALYVGHKLQFKLIQIPVHHSGVSRTPAWVLFAFLGCYALLVPGLFTVLFGYEISAMGFVVLQSTESMVSFVKLLAETNCWLGAILVILYAMVIPAVKLVLLVLSEVWRRGTPRQIVKAHHCHHVLQYISKWASPDMFAYIMLLYLLRGLDCPPSPDHPLTLRAKSELDIGFTCFAVFCVGTTLAALGLKEPLMPTGQARAPWRCCGLAQRPAVVLAINVALCAVFLPALIVGLGLPSMSLSVSTDAMYKPNGKLDRSLKPFIDSLNLEELANSDVSIRGCMEKLAKWTAEGEANSFIAFFLFAVCVVATTVLDMGMLLTASVMMWYRAELPATPTQDASSKSKPVLPIRMAKVLKKFSFLDVAIVGIVVVVVSGQAYSAKGLSLTIAPGLALLTLAEICHYVSYYLVMYTYPITLSIAGTRAQGDTEGDVETEQLPTLMTTRPSDTSNGRAANKFGLPTKADVNVADVEAGEEVHDCDDKSAPGNEQPMHAVQFWEDSPADAASERVRNSEGGAHEATR